MRGKRTQRLIYVINALLRATWTVVFTNINRSVYFFFFFERERERKREGERERERERERGK